MHTCFLFGVLYNTYIRGGPVSQGPFPGSATGDHYPALNDPTPRGPQNNHSNIRHKFVIICTKSTLQFKGCKNALLIHLEFDKAALLAVHTWTTEELKHCRKSFQKDSFYQSWYLTIRFRTFQSLRPPPPYDLINIGNIFALAYKTKISCGYLK